MIGLVLHIKAKGTVLFYFFFQTRKEQSQINPVLNETKIKGEHKGGARFGFNYENFYVKSWFYSNC